MQISKLSSRMVHASLIMGLVGAFPMATTLQGQDAPALTAPVAEGAVAVTPADAPLVAAPAARPSPLFERADINVPAARPSSLFERPGVAAPTIAAAMAASSASWGEGDMHTITVSTLVIVLAVVILVLLID